MQNCSVQIPEMMHGTKNLCGEVIYYIYEYYWLRANILQRMRSFLSYLSPTEATTQAVLDTELKQNLDLFRHMSAAHN